MKTRTLFFVTLLAVPAFHTQAQNYFPDSGKVRINTAHSYNTLDVYGSMGLGSGLDNVTARPPVSSGTLAGELRGIGAHNHSDDGFLRLSAGGGINTGTKSFIDLSGYMANGDERHQNITMGTSGLERLRISYTGNVGIGLTEPMTALDVNGAMGLRSGTINSTPRPPVNSSTMPGELRGIGGHYYSDDGFLRLSAGGGTNTYTKSFIDLSGYTDNFNERHQNIIMATSGEERVRIDHAGNVGIGTTQMHGYRLAVNGNAIFTKVKVKAFGAWPDYVFEGTHHRPALADLEQYIQQNKRLPGMPSANEVAAQGIDLGEMNRKLLEKVEELTLYIIEQHKKSEQQEKRLNAQQQQISALQQKLGE